MVDKYRSLIILLMRSGSVLIRYLPLLVMELVLIFLLGGLVCSSEFFILGRLRLV